MKQGERQWRAQITEKRRPKKKVRDDADTTSATGYHSHNSMTLNPKMLTKSLAAQYLTRYRMFKVDGWMGGCGDALDAMAMMERWSARYMKKTDIDQFDTAGFEYPTQILLRPLVVEISAATSSMNEISGS